MDKANAPLFDKLVSYYQRNSISFHVPGHKMGEGFSPLGRKVYQEILKIDMTEIPGLDDLHQPEGVILEAEQRAAKLFGADHTFFLVNGSTTGNLAMILATCQPGDKIIVQRNVHKSVIHGLMLARAVPIYINPKMIPQLGIAGSINKESLEQTLRTHPDAKGVFIMNPNYYGIGIDLKEIIDLVHSYKIPILVDEAHGAHFGLHPSFPSSSLEMGADIVVQSTHKTLFAMTMGSMLHVRSKYIDVDRLKLYLSMIQTSSPSYPIMASLDLTCHWIEKEGKGLWDNIIQLLDDFYQKVDQLKIMRVKHRLDRRYFLDPLKIIIHSQNKKVSGVDIQKYLEQKNIYLELADLYNALSIVTPGTSYQDLKRLSDGLWEIEQTLINSIDDIQDIENTEVGSVDHFIFLNNKQSKISLEKILYSKTRLVSLQESIGKIAAEMVIPYPPGIPVLQLGEEITKETIEYLIELKDKGIRFQGIHDHYLQRIKVLDQ
ncbi:hypothetical protein BHF71_05040 [Vulcanibacillus modesticaldus]|uniref:Arginine decarboxylase n=1 Tax=Vulcanibacillus modesticaldus TaxID=337097 RepID=A0A1D2YXA4_9BACI|nr:aminotransferase class I/II-fold pyridoxal phosphate-dependent enzyme [Vulcanibacillus modesticaldus]OEG00273.1 hypothetical protein BHF71_05040 [Vulcanibacillus modesticaldus]